MATTTANLSLTKPEATDATLIREDINANSDLIDAQFAATYLAPQAKNAVTITGGNITGITDLAIADGGTASSTASAARTALSVSSRALDNIASCAINAALLLGTSDGGALGSATKMWSDLFLASGAVINFDNGNLTLTHSAATLTFTGKLVGNGSGLTGVGESTATALTISCKAAEDIDIGEVVYVSGATGNKPQVNLADNTHTDKHTFCGVAAETQTSGQTILVRVRGELTTLNTNSFEVGNTLYLSTGGAMVNAAPTSGAIEIIGYVTVKSATVGKIVILHHSAHGIHAPSTDDIVIRMGDSAASNKVYFKDYANAEVGYIDSDGKANFTSLLLNDAVAKPLEITSAATTAQLYIGGSNILANGEQAIYVNCPSEDGATNAMWLTLGSIVVTGDVIGARIKVTTNAATGGGAASGQNVRGVYSQAIAAASDDAGLLQGGLFTADVSAGSVTAYNIHALCGHYSAGASAVIGGDLYVGYLRAQSRSTNSRTVTGNDFCLALENEAVEGTGMKMDGAIRIFDTNVSGDAFTYGVDMNDATLTTDIRLSDAHTIADSATGIAISLLSPTTISGLSDVTSADADYILIWDATDSTLKKCDMGEVRGAGGGYTNLTEFVDQTAWRVFYSNTAGDVVELALGADGTYLKSNGAAVAPTFGTPAGAGDVTKVGTPANDQVGVWTGDGTIEGTAGLTYSGTVLTISGDIILGANSIGRDADNDIDFETDNQILFRLSGVDGALFGSTGELDMNANSIGFTQQTVTYNSGTTTADWTNGNKAIMTFGAGNITTFAFTNPTNPCNLLLKIVQDATGSRVVTGWDADIKWAGGSAPTLTTGANTIDVISFYFDGSAYYGVASLAFS